MSAFLIIMSERSPNDSSAELSALGRLEWIFLLGLDLRNACLVLSINDSKVRFLVLDGWQCVLSLKGCGTYPFSSSGLAM